MNTGRDEALVELTARWPAWEIWVVCRAVGGARWCARLRANHARLLHAGRPGELDEYLAEASGQEREGLAAAAGGAGPSR